MAYSTIADIESLIKWTTFSTTSKVTTSEVTEYIVEADTYINSKLERIYNVPITDSDDIEILKYISSRFAAVEVAQVLILQAGGEVPTIVKEWLARAKERLEKILNLEIDLPNSTKIDLSTHGKLYSFTAYGDDENDAPTPQWNTGVDEW